MINLPPTTGPGSERVERIAGQTAVKQDSTQPSTPPSSGLGKETGNPNMVDDLDIESPGDFLTSSPGLVPKSILAEAAYRRESVNLLNLGNSPPLLLKYDELESLSLTPTKNIKSPTKSQTTQTAQTVKVIV